MFYYVIAEHWNFGVIEALYDYDDYPKVTKFYRKYTKKGYKVSIELMNNKEKLNWW